MPALVVYEYEAAPPRIEAYADAVSAYKYAVNELVEATHDSLPAATGEIREVLQRTFTLLSERTLAYEERYRRGRALWRRVRVLAEQGTPVPALGPRRRPSPLIDLFVFDEPAVATLQQALGFEQ